MRIAIQKKKKDWKPLIWNIESDFPLVFDNLNPSIYMVAYILSLGSSPAPQAATRNVISRCVL